MFFFHHKSVMPKPRYVGWLYGLLILIFAVITQYSVVVGLVGLGSLLLVAGIFVEMNADRIWDESKKWAKQNRKSIPWWNRPTHSYYVLNRFVLWPLVIVIGIAALVIAYKLI